MKKNITMVLIAVLFYAALGVLFYNDANANDFKSLPDEVFVGEILSQLNNHDLSSVNRACQSSHALSDELIKKRKKQAVDDATKEIQELLGDEAFKPWTTSHKRFKTTQGGYTRLLGKDSLKHMKDPEHWVFADCFEFFDDYVDELENRLRVLWPIVFPHQKFHSTKNFGRNFHFARLHLCTVDVEVHLVQEDEEFFDMDEF